MSGFGVLFKLVLCFLCLLVDGVYRSGVFFGFMDVVLVGVVS